MTGSLVRYFAAAAFSVALPGCAHHEGPAPSYAQAGNQRFSSDDIVKSGSTNAWDFLRRNARRYDFVEDRYGTPRNIKTRRGTSTISMSGSDTPMVIVDGARIIDFVVLRDLTSDSIQSIELLNGINGTAAHGTNAVAGVIYIHTWQASSDTSSRQYSKTTK